MPFANNKFRFRNRFNNISQPQWKAKMEIQRGIVKQCPRREIELTKRSLSIQTLITTVWLLGRIAVLARLTYLSNSK